MTSKNRFLVNRGAASQSLKADELNDLWAAYRGDRADERLRNRLVEHYLPWTHKTAASVAVSMRLDDAENAVGDVLAALVERIVPDYDGRGKFTAWARICIKRMLIARRRKQHAAQSIFEDSPKNESGELLDLDEIPAAEEAPADPGPLDAVDFLDATADLPDRQAAILWLRFQRGASIITVAEMLRMHPSRVKALTVKALLAIKKSFGTADFFGPRAY
jgi:RNA polymerase sigma factor (sigma-70 family)